MSAEVQLQGANSERAEQLQHDSRFLRLPMEVRLLIYAYTWEDEVYAIDWIPGQEALGSEVVCLREEVLSNDFHRQHCQRDEIGWKIHNNILHWVYRNGQWHSIRYKDYSPRAPDFPFNRAALLLTCRQIYEETSRIFYNNIILRLPDYEVVQRLLSILSPASKSSIRSLEVMYYPPADPPEDEDCGTRYCDPWYVDEEKQRDAWADAIKTIAEQLTGLTNLTLYTHVHDCQCLCGSKHKVGLDKKWARPLMALKSCPLVSLDVFGNCRLVLELLSLELLGPDRGSSNIGRVQLAMEKNVYRG